MTTKKKPTVKKSEQISFLDEVKAPKISVPVTPVTEKPMSSDQAKQFLYMLNRMEAWRKRRLSEAKTKAKLELESATKEYTLEDLLKDIKSGKVRPLTVSKRKLYVSSQNVNTSEIEGREKSSSKNTQLDTIKLYVEDLHFNVNRRNSLKQIDTDYDKSLVELTESIAFYRVRLRTGNMSNHEANAIIEQLTEAWAVPMSVVAEADHSNQTCTK